MIYRQGNAHITLVIGPPCSGKSTYIEQKKSRGDLIWDFDVVLQAITSLPLYERCDGAVPFCLAMRDAFLAKAVHGRGAVSKVWVAMSSWSPIANDLQRYGAEIVKLDTAKEVCLSRAELRGPENLKMVTEWFAKNGPTS